MGGAIGGSYAGPKEVQYLFIDGEQLRCTLDEMGQTWFGKAISIDYRSLQGSCQKVFYYDCLPAKGHSEDDSNYASKKAAKEAFFDELRAIPGWHVSEGLARHRKKERQEQKEVDILIAVDMLTHTYRRNMHRLTFLSGDQDFAPLLEAVVREGMYVELLYPEGRTSRDLKHFADTAQPLSVDFLYGKATEAFRRSNGLPIETHEVGAIAVGAREIEAGYVEDQLVARVWVEAQGTFQVRAAVEDQLGRYRVVRHSDQTIAKSYFDLKAGPKDWRRITGH